MEEATGVLLLHETGCTLFLFSSQRDSTPTRTNEMHAPHTRPQTPLNPLVGPVTTTTGAGIFGAGRYSTANVGPFNGAFGVPVSAFGVSGWTGFRPLEPASLLTAGQ